MATRAQFEHIASQARRLYIEEVVKGLTPLIQAVLDAARVLVDKPSEHAVFQRRRELLQSLMAGAQGWHCNIVTSLRHVLNTGSSSSRPSELSTLANANRESLSLVSDDTIDLEIVTSRLALAIMDRASWEFSDLRSRVAHLEGRKELEPQDMLRAHVLARIVFDGWRAAALNLEGWREVQSTLNDEFALLVEEAYHEANRWLCEQGVLPEVDLRPFIRRSRTHPQAASLTWQVGSGFIGLHPGDGSTIVSGGPVFSGTPQGTASGGWAGGVPAGRRLATWHGADSLSPSQVGDETRLMTRTAPLARSQENAEAVMGRLNRLVGRHVPDFGMSSMLQGVRAPVALSEGLSRAIHSAQLGLQQRLEPGAPGGFVVTTPVMLEELHQRKQVLKSRCHARRARHDRNRGAAVSEHPNRRPHPGRHPRLVCAAADAGAARGCQRTRLLCHRGPPSAAPD